MFRFLTLYFPFLPFTPSHTHQARERSQEALLMPIYRQGTTVLVKRAPWRQLGWYTFMVGWVDQQLTSHPKDHNGLHMQRGIDLFFFSSFGTTF